MLKVSIIIPCREVDGYVEECIQHCLKLDYKEYEVLVLPDSPYEGRFPDVQVIPTGVVRPSVKRNIGISQSGGDIVAFIDSDAYPRGDWLRNAVKYFDGGVVAVGGPGLNPPDDSPAQKAGGLVFESRVGGGGLSHRYRVGAARDVDDLPSFNLLVLRRALEGVGGFKVDYWPGEDTYLCLQLLRGGGRLLYAPDVVVYHHKRPLFRPHLRQVAGYGFHRGLFARRFPGNSRRLMYFLPSLLVLGLVVGFPLSVVWLPVRVAYVTAILLYLLVGLEEGLRLGGLRLGFLVWVGVVATHIVYGVNFIRGLASK